MTFLNKTEWEIAAGLAVTALVAAGAAWLVLRKRPTPDEVERIRRQFLAQSGRLVDGMLLDVYDVNAEDQRNLTMLLFNYRIGGVDYECSQDITAMLDVVEVSQVRAGFPCSVRYQPGNPQNSIVVAEGWSGLRKGLPQLPSFDDPDPLDTSHLKPGGESPEP
ncbi:MAG: hypothetical protein WBC92_03015 [Terracidiphilus sp.]